jgi:hypothetical protein
LINFRLRAWTRLVVRARQTALNEALAQAFDGRPSDTQGLDNFVVHAAVIGFEQDARSCELTRPVLTAMQQCFQLLAFAVIQAQQILFL